MKKLAKILALMLVLTMGVCMFTGCSDEGKVEGVVEDYLDAIIDAEFDEAAELVGDDEAKAEMEDMQKMSDEDSEREEKYLDSMEGTEYEIKDVKVDGDKATVEVELSKDDESSTMEFEVEKVDGDWLIMNIKNK